MLYVASIFTGLLAASGTPSVPVVDVFNRGENGYYCIKIPYLTSLPNGDLLAFAEGRRNGCGDGAWTDLISKRSKDGGATWSPIKVIHAGDAAPTTIGNAAPIVVGSDIVLLYNSNNAKVYLRRSHDWGHTWTDFTDISENTTLPNWGFMGTGPPSGLLLSTGRLVVPAYHHLKDPILGFSPMSHCHALLSDDRGYTWRMSADGNYGTEFCNENQAVDLSGNRVAIFARGMGSRRTRVESTDGGEHWGKAEVLQTLPDMFTGCEGSTISCLGEPAKLVHAGVSNPGVIRKEVSIFSSTDEGHTWKRRQIVDSGSSAYTAMAWHAGRLGLLYERSHHLQLIFEPDNITFALLDNPCNSTIDAFEQMV